jgi:hypothetical protein
MEVLQSTSTIGRWVKGVTAPKTGKAELLDLHCSGRPVTAVSPEMLQRADAIIARISTSQLDNWQSVFQIAREALVTSFEILDIRRCAWDGLLRGLQANTKLREKPFLPSC